MRADPFINAICYVRREGFGAPWSGVHMAVAAGLVALAADVELQGQESFAFQ